MNQPKIVENPHYHLWTDALHACALSHQANNKWDRGAYVRWTVATAWTVLEIACQNALNEPKISYRFRKNLETAINRQGFQPLEWGTGIWQLVIALQKQRKGYVHRFLSEQNLFPEAKIADEAIDVVRKAVEAIYQHVGQPPPAWIQDADDRGWDTGKRGGANLTIIHQGASEDDPKVIRLFYVHMGSERLSEVFPSGTDYQPYVDGLIHRVRVPISAVKVYEGDRLVYEKNTMMRGT
ncbi:MAG: hypothetical protein KF749_08050 [Bacteroidetes bacterium]|nr:hypothetical protein [Bacteroidota bacterium]MCW5894907.1 hypothetical protein [Bacteroidota bacterium]